MPRRRNQGEGMQPKEARVLVLGEPDGAARLETALRSAGYEEIHVSDDLSAPVALCRELEPTVVLIDLTGPDYAGLDALRDLTPSDEAPAVAVVSAPSDGEVRSESIALGAKDFIAKPLDDDEVRVRVGN